MTVLALRFFRAYLKSISADTLSDAGHLQDRVVEFVKRSLMKKAFSEAYLAYEKGEYEGISALFDKAYQKSDLLGKDRAVVPGHG